MLLSRGNVTADEGCTRLSPNSSKETLLDPDDRENHNTIGTFVASDKAVSIASCFLTDYEAGRSPTLSSDFHNISVFQLRIYRFQHSFWWRWLGLYPALFFMFLADFPSRIWTASLHIEAVLIFLVDMKIRRYLCCSKEWELHEDSQKELLIQKATFAFLVVHGIQSCLGFFVHHSQSQERISTIVVSLFKPILFFYISPRARAALEALIRIGSIIARVVVIELFLILTFAAVACRVYYEEDGFQSLATSWLSLFQLSTTVVNPSLWMPLYSNSRVNAFFFVFFIIVCVFYLHSLTLSVVFQVFIQAATDVHNRSVHDKEKSLRCAYSVLSSTQLATQVDEVLIRRTLEQVRPHYGQMKIDILMGLINPAKKLSFDYPSFRAAIRDALDASVRTSTKVTYFGNIVEKLSVLVALANFLFVTLLTSSSFQTGWLLHSVLVIGSLITLFGIVELAIRGNIWKTTFNHKTKLNVVFDGFAAIGALISCYGIGIYIAGYPCALDYMLTGRAIDMVRTMRFFPMFRDVVERSIDVLPALAGPVFLVFTTIHIFVNIGIGLWGGRIDVEDLTNNNQNLQPLYSLNNFNSYTEGLVTIFNVLVINDWHEIAKVFLNANRHSHPVIVYTYFVIVVLIAVCIMLNVITAFFVEAFTARLSKDDLQKDGVIRFHRAQSEVQLSTSKDNFNSNISDQESINLFMLGKNDASMARNQVFMPADKNEMQQFDVFNRQGFDRIMQAVTQSTSEKEKIAKCLCATLEAFTSTLFYEIQSVEFLVTCRTSLQFSEFQSVGFRQTISEFLEEHSWLRIISELTTPLVDSTTASDQFLRRVRQFVHPRVPTVMLELIMTPVPNVTDMWLIIVRRRQTGGADC